MINKKVTTNKFSEMLGEELRKLAFSPEKNEIHKDMSEEDYTALIDFELSLQQPDSRIMAFCYKGLCQFESYGKETEKEDINVLIKKAGFSKNPDAEVRTFSVLDFKKRNYVHENKSDRNAKVLKGALKQKMHDAYESNGITFVITNNKGFYNLSWINNDLLYNIDNKLSLNDVNEFLWSYVA